MCCPMRESGEGNNLERLKEGKKKKQVKHQNKALKNVDLERP